MTEAERWNVERPDTPGLPPKPDVLSFVRVHLPFGVMAALGIAICLGMVRVVFGYVRLGALGGGVLFAALAASFVLRREPFNRGVITVAAIWLVDVYAVLLELGCCSFAGMIHLVLVNSAKTVFVVLATSAPRNERMADVPSHTERLLPAYGYYELLRWAIVLVVAILFTGTGIARMRDFVLNDPLFCLVHVVLSDRRQWDPWRYVGTVPLVAYVLTTLAAIPAARAMMRRHHPDLEACGLALLVLAIWMSLLGLYSVVERLIW